MSTASTTSPLQTPANTESIGQRLRAPQTLISIALLASAFLFLFFRWFERQGRISYNHPDDWGHAFFIPVIAGYVLWTRKQHIAKTSTSIYWPGLMPMLLGILTYFYFTLVFANHMNQGFALVLTFAGLSLFLTGPKLFPSITFPIAYLGFGVTIAESTMIKITAKLQLWASFGSDVLLRMIGSVSDFTVERAGNVIEITTDKGQFVPLNVAEACSGMRMVVAFYALGAAIAFLSCKEWWQRIALLLLAGPIAIFVNVLRVSTLGIASIYNPELAKGSAHMFIGVLWLLPAFGLFLAVVWALNKMIHTPKATNA